MKTISFTCLMVFLFLSHIFAQNKGTTGPLNPEYLKFLETGQQIQKSKDGHYLGRIPSPVSVYFSKKVEKSAVNIPDKYDLREIEGGKYLSPVRNQGDAGTCWAFGALGAVESYWRKMDMGKPDFSEHHMATCHGFDGGPDGGFPLMAFSYLSRYSGAVLEKDVPYNLPDNQECQTNVVPYGLINEFRHLPGKQTYQYDEQLLDMTKSTDEFDPDIIKVALMEVGVIDTDIYWDDFYYNPVDYTYFYNGKSFTNHEILLVGWDDNKVVTGSNIIKPAQKGAWIFRNSWGNDWGEKGYFYVSYEDTKVLSEIAFYPSASYYNGYNVVLQYDELGKTDTYGYNQETASGIVKFTPKKDIDISSIGTYAVTGGATLEIELYDNFDGYKLTNQRGNTLKQTVSLPGFYTLSLPLTVTINAYNDVYVKLKCTTPGYNYSLAVETQCVGGSSGAIIEQDKYWVSDTGANGSWYQLGNEPDQQFDLCIKAYAEYSPSPSIANMSITNKNKNIKAPDVFVYMNSSGDRIVIECNSDIERTDVQIMDMNGRLVSTVLLIEDHSEIDICNLPKGTYVALIRYNEMIIERQKLVVY